MERSKKEDREGIDELTSRGLEPTTLLEKEWFRTIKINWSPEISGGLKDKG